MAHHKRRRPKNARSGCKLCKPWKINHAKRSRENLGRHGVIERVIRREAGIV